MPSRQIHLQLLRDLLYQMMLETAEVDDIEVMKVRLSSMSETLSYLLSKL